ncbi:MAG: helix-turn-helix transcriptional regulator [Pseudomonadota bacterium]|nr:helix-turn-helix transcriptional regulator [Pseudomonadota bacterium]
MSALSLRIRKARSAAALSQAELARRVGVKRSAVTQWEHPAGTCPSVDHLIQIAMQTNTMFEWLATGRGPSHADNLESTPAVMIDEYARDADESLALGQLRLLSPMKRRIALDILVSLAR